jgi:hypothetical protein
MSRVPITIGSISAIGDGMWVIEQADLGESNVAFTNCYVLEDTAGDVHLIDPGEKQCVDVGGLLERTARGASEQHREVHDERDDADDEADPRSLFFIRHEALLH